MQKSKVKNQNYNSKLKTFVIPDHFLVIPAPMFIGINSGGLMSPNGEIYTIITSVNYETT